MDPKLIHDLDPTLHEKSRLSITAVLAERERLTFVQLKQLLGMTDGNLSVHIRRLEKKGYVITRKDRENGKLRTSCRLSKEGRKALRQYVSRLDRLVQEVRKPRRRGKKSIRLN